MTRSRHEVKVFGQENRETFAASVALAGRATGPTSCCPAPLSGLRGPAGRKGPTALPDLRVRSMVIRAGLGPKFVACAE